MNCLIIDDEPIARKLLQEFITDTSFLNLMGSAENPLQALPLLNELNIHLIFLDINMPKMTGLEFLKTSSQLPLCILTTAYTEYAVESFELNVSDYLVKPFSYERFLKACLKAKDYYELRNNETSGSEQSDFFFVKCNGRIEKVKYDELLYAEAMLNYVTLYTENEKMIVYLTMKNLEEQLPKTMFLKIHKSTIINIQKIKNIEGNQITINKSKLTISQNLHDSVLKFILKDKMLKR